MSQYEDYDETCRNYDNGRHAAGADIMAGLMKIYINKEFKDIHVLDAGCGTGNYSLAFLELGVGRMSMMDASDGMLSIATGKMATNNLQDKVDIKRGILPTMPFPDETFDVVMFNQVLHHLEREPNGTLFPGRLLTFAEANRVLKPHGLLIINDSTPEQMSSIWYTNLNQSMLYKSRLRYPCASEYRSMLARSKYDILSYISVLGNGMLPNYKCLEGFLDKNVRDTDSYWALGTEQELQCCLRRIREIKENDVFDAYFKKYDKTNENGLFCIIAARKQE